MSLEKIYIVRHGFRPPFTVTPDGQYRCAAPTPTGIPADPPLTAHGIAQATELAAHLSTDPFLSSPRTSVAVFSSPYYRCLQTLEPWLSRLSPPTPARVRGLHGMGEWFGAAPFTHPAPAAASTLARFFPWYVDDDDDARPDPHGESYDGLVARVGGCLGRLVARCDAEGRRAAVVCSHAAVVIVAGRVLTGRHPGRMEARDFGAFTCGLSVFERGGDDGHSGEDKVVGGWRCVRNSDCSFLSGGEERGWSFSGDESFPGTGSLSQNRDEKDAVEPKL